MMKEVIPMKFKRILYLFIFLQFLLFAAHSFAADTDLYVGDTSSIQPNLLIIFDNSGSMGSVPGPRTYCNYDPAFSYPQPAGIPYVEPTVVYRMSGTTWFPAGSPAVYKNSVAEVACSTARTRLELYNRGMYSGRPDYSNCYSGNYYTIATGNWVRFNFADQEDKETCATKLEIAQDVIENFVSTVVGVRIGLMYFNSEITLADGTRENEGGYIRKEVKDLDEGTNRQDLIDAVNSTSASTYTPLAETLYEAGLYFQGAQSYFNAPPYKTSTVTYTSPIQYYCQRNYVVIMTDGISTRDINDILNTIGDQDGDQREPPGAPYDPGFESRGSDFLDDVAKYLYDTDIHSLQGKQNIITYTIGYELDSSDPDNADEAKSLLQRAATLGHGKFFTTEGSAGLANAFAGILNEVLALNSAFVAPIVPVSKMERTTSGDKIYLAFFRPNASGMWTGNIKKYGVAQTKNPSSGIEVGDILDSTGSKALDSKGEFYATVKSYWTTSSQDGGEVEVGGVGEVLKARTAARNIYTLLPGDASDEDNGADDNTSFDLTNSWNAFATTNDRITISTLGVSTTEEKDQLINFVRGIDAYDDNGNGDTTDKRNWMLGSFLHSRPFIIHYADQTVIYAGSNDGMLHAFDDDTGEELWGFIPPCLLSRLTELHRETPMVFVDGSPKAYVSYNSDGITVNKAILIFGLRRGGNYYYALDVTDPTAPKYLWRIYRNRGGVFKELGQTWSIPVIGKVAYGTGEKWVAIFGAGYDADQDLASPPSDDIGRGIYIADVLTGAFVWGKSYQEGATAMTYAIPSDVAPVDLDGDGKIDRVYVGDLNSRMWRVDLGDLSKDGSSDPSEWTVKKIFEPDIAEKRKIFYPPDVTFEKDSTGEYEMLFFGTGDREDPEGVEPTKDRLYALKDRNYSGTLNKTDLVDITLFYAKTAAEQTTMLNSIKSKYGWYLQLNKKEGEKCLASPVVYYKVAYFTTFSPSPELIDDPCYVGDPGAARLYALNYATGEAALNLDLTNDVGGIVINADDRGTFIGASIPSGVVVTVIGGKVTAYIGVGGGVYKPTLSGTRSLFPVYWKLVF
jgi:type IV pilus assembly protein PilY1